MDDRSSGSLTDLVTQAGHRLAKTVLIERGDQVNEYLLQEMRGDVYVRLTHLAMVQSPEGPVLDTHRLQALRIIASLAGDCEPPGDTIDAKMGHMVQTEAGPQPLIDVISKLPNEMFLRLDEAAQEVNLAISKLRQRFEQQLAGSELAIEVMAYCMEQGMTLHDLAVKEVYMSEIVAMRAVYRELRFAESQEQQRLMRAMGSATA